MVKGRDSNEFKSALVPSALPADRNDLRRSALDPEDDPNIREERLLRSMFNNTSRIPHGHAQLMAAITAGKPESRTTIQTEKERQRREESARYISQEMQRLAEWNAKVVTIAGVQMTNEDAQRARRHFIENEDECAERAVRRGLIRDGEQDVLKHAMRRRHDLEERVGRGDATAAEHKELHDIKQSRMGRATDEITAEIHTGNYVDLNANVKSERAATAPEAQLPSAREIFQTAPIAQTAFTQAANPSMTEDAEPKTPTITPVPVSHEIKVTGLGV